MQLKYYFLFILLIPLASSAIHDPKSTGASSLGMGTIGVVGTQYHSLFNNQAALAYVSKTTIGVDYNQGFFSDKNLSTKSVGALSPTGWGTLGVSFQYFGYQFYNEQKIGLAYGKQLGEKIAVGVQLNYFRTYIGNDYGNANALSFEIGIYSKLTEQLELGAHIFNPIGAEIGNNYPEKIPIAFNLGLLYHVDKHLSLATEVEKILDEKTNYKFGLEYDIGNYLISRIGIATQPTLFTFGFGVRYNQLIFDIGTGYHQSLGFTPAVSLLFKFK